MKRIFKYILKIHDFQTIEMPEEAEILYFAEESGNLCIWVLANETNPIVARTFAIRWTDKNFTEYNKENYIGTIITSIVVYHLFEVE